MLSNYGLSFGHLWVDFMSQHFITSDTVISKGKKMYVKTAGEDCSGSSGTDFKPLISCLANKIIFL